MKRFREEFKTVVFGLQNDPIYTTLGIIGKKLEKNFLNFENVLGILNIYQKSEESNLPILL